MFVVVFAARPNHYPRHENRFRFSMLGHRSVKSPQLWGVSREWFEPREGAEEHAAKHTADQHAFIIEVPVDPFAHIP